MLIVRLAAFIVAVAMMVDAVCSLASWRRLSDQLERVRADLADRINESLADASDSMLERIPDSAIDSVAQTHIRSRAVNAWLAELGDATLDALREKASMPTFISDGAHGLALAAAAWLMPRRACPIHRSPVSVPAGARTVRCRVMSLSRRDLRFFNAFPRLRITATRVSFEQLISATALTSCFGASRDRARSRPPCSRIPVRFAPLLRRFQDCGAVGDGTIWVEPVEEAIRIRTGEHGPSAV